MTSVYSIRFLKHASKELGKLDKHTAQRIVGRLNWLSSNIRSSKVFPLKGELSGLFKVREGSYRIIFEMIHSEQTVIIHSIGHRKDIYKQM
ncbi:MAG: type II toxin-antitoxin system RelE/ParE family toxin [Bacteroidetes bacterium]|nr:type II toxin-antitoxin system RelE/ParE family toxin [Bacteroidota bacterium]MBU1678632.1 type II toxin-antitoxin system RelE/ParE family toxin [Bacteroidota bacterium]MBU2507762.1 type II toxin-antitoxin system RelE/ParE family toxin [Bacteroidota bacterium]